MPSVDDSLLSRVARELSQPPTYAEEGVKGSILTAAAASYGWRPAHRDETLPTGFNPEAAALFEAVVEGAFLVANADGDFDAAERGAFKHVVLTACAGAVAERQMEALLSDLADQLAEDGLDKRVKMVARAIARIEHAREVLRIGALLAHVSGGVSDVERAVLLRLAGELGLDAVAVEAAIEEVARELAA
jgi:tellurite resistance protein